MIPPSYWYVPHAAVWWWGWWSLPTPPPPPALPPCLIIAAVFVCFQSLTASLYSQLLVCSPSLTSSHLLSDSIRFLYELSTPGRIPHECTMNMLLSSSSELFNPIPFRILSVRRLCPCDGCVLPFGTGILCSRTRCYRENLVTAPR